MNIAYVVPEFVTEVTGGGLASYINNIAQILAARGHEITVIVKSGVSERLSYRENITVERVFVDLSKTDAQIPGSFYREWSRVLNQRLLALHRERRFDIVQYANWTALALHRTDIPTIVRISSDLPRWRAASTLQYDLEKQYGCIKITDYLEELALMQADAVFGPSQLLADVISTRTGVPVKVIESPFAHQSLREDETVYRNTLMGKPYILTFGSLNLLKGSKLIGDVIYHVLDRNPELIYAFAGSDYGWNLESGEHISAIDYIKAHAGNHANRVVYAGALDREALYPIIRNSLFCVLPSRVDNLPNTCIEAMSFEKVVIGTRGASFEQLICDGVSGVLVPRENPSALQDAIDRTLSIPPETLRQMGLCARERTKLLSADKIAEKTLALYRQTISSVAQNGRTPVFNRDYYNWIVEQCKNTSKPS